MNNMARVTVHYKGFELEVFCEDIDYPKYSILNLAPEDNRPEETGSFTYEIMEQKYTSDIDEFLDCATDFDMSEIYDVIYTELFEE